MEATLPTSTAANDRSRPGAIAALPVSLPLRFIVTGLLSLFGGVGWLVTRPDLLTVYHYSPDIIAVTHLLVLGWLCSVVMGAMYQLAPVTLETRLYSARVAKWHFVFHLVGFAGMVWMFHKWDIKQVGHFASALAVGVGLFVWNIARTLLRAPKWSVSATAFTSALVWFSLTVAVGLSIAAAKCSYGSTSGAATATGVRSVVGGLRELGAFVARFDALSVMHAHAHLGVIGLFTMLIVGASYKLIPMFTLSELQSRRRALASVMLLNVGLLGAVGSIWGRSPAKQLFAFVIVAALAVYAWELAAILRARKRIALDWGVKTFLTAVAVLLALSLLGAVLAGPGLPLNEFTARLETLYGFLGLLGFVTFAIIGLLHKILPFLVWFHAYGPRVGREPVPALADLYSARLQIAGYWAWLGGLTVIGAGILLPHGMVIRVGAALLAMSLILFGVNVAKILSHLFPAARKSWLQPMPKIVQASLLSQ